MRERPECGLEALDRPSSGADGRRLPSEERSRGDGRDRRTESFILPEPLNGLVHGRGEGGDRRPQDRAGEEPGEVPAGVDRVRCGMRGPTHGRSLSDGPTRVAGEEDGHRGDPDQRPVPGYESCDRSGLGHPGPEKGLERAAGRGPDIEADPGRRLIPLAPVPDVAPELVDRVRAAAGDQALGQAEGEGRILRPAAGGEIQDPPLPVSGDRGEGAGLQKLDGGTESVSDREPDDGPEGRVLNVDRHRKRYVLCYIKREPLRPDSPEPTAGRRPDSRKITGRRRVWGAIKLGHPPLRPAVPSGSRQGADPLRSTGGVPFGRIPSGGAPAGGVPVKFLPPGGAPAGGVPFGTACPGDAPDGNVPFGRTRSCGGPAGVAASDSFVSEAVPSGDVVDAVPMPASAVGVVVEPAVQPAVQAKQPRTVAIARISRRMRGLPSPAGDSLFMSVLVLVMLSKNRGRSETGEPVAPPALCPLLTGVIVAT